jgi:putative FmdB family regulatory protein
MPIYSYKCEKCGSVFDKFEKASNGNENNGVVKCIYCGSDAKRLFSPAGLIFKGSGFYKTDYRSTSRNTGGGGKSIGKDIKKPGTKETAARDNKTKADKEVSKKSGSSVPEKTG